jgi:polysaccharide biosynthesis/export protein
VAFQAGRAEKGFSGGGFSDNIRKAFRKKEPMKMKSLIHCVALAALSMFAAVFLVVLSGCKTTAPHSGQNMNMSAATNDIVLREADVVRIDIPADSKLNATEAIRRDGKITLPVIGEIVAAGKTPDQLRQELVERYSKEIVSSKEISVVVISSSFSVYVTGAVLKPGEVVADHPLTALEAIMKAGGYDPDKALLKSVKVVRTLNGKTETHILNLSGVQKPGAPVDNFYLQPLDIVIVPQKFVIF